MMKLIHFCIRGIPAAGDGGSSNHRRIMTKLLSVEVVMFALGGVPAILGGGDAAEDGGLSKLIARMKLLSVEVG